MEWTPESLTFLLQLSLFPHSVGETEGAGVGELGGVG